MKLKLLFLTLTSLSALHAMEESAHAEHPSVKIAQKLSSHINTIRSLLLSCEKPGLLQQELYEYSKEFDAEDPRPHNFWRSYQGNLESTAKVAVILAKEEAKTITAKCVSFVCEATLNPKSAIPAFELGSPTNLLRIKAMEKTGSKKEDAIIPDALQKLKEKSAQQLINALENQSLILSKHRH
jgi:hypothetical protein